MRISKRKEDEEGGKASESDLKNQIQMTSSSVIVNKKDELNYSRQRHKRSRIHTKSASIQKLLSYKNCFHTKTVRSRTLTKKEYSRNREEKQLERPSHAEERASMCRTKAKERRKRNVFIKVEKLLLYVIL